MQLRALLAWILLVLASARAQPAEIVVPADRFAAPGEYVTLVFRIEAAAPIEIDVVAETERGWQVLRQVGTLQLEPGRSTPVVVTVEVPSDAPALSTESVWIRVDVGGERIERRVALTVTELLDLDLEAPREAVLGRGGLTVVAVNRGNAADDVVVEFRRGTEVLQRRELTLAPGGREEIVFDLEADGAHSVVLMSSHGTEVRRSVSVLRFGVAEPEPFALAADLAVGVTSAGSARSTFAVKGALSDFAALDARVEAPGLQRSFAELTVEGGALRVGAGWRDPFGLRLPAGIGVAGTLARDGWGVAAAVGHLGDDRFAGVAAASWSDGPLRLAGGIGAAAGEPLLALRADHELSDRSLGASAAWDGDGASLGGRAEFRDEAGVTDLRAEALGLGTDRGRVDLGVRIRAGDDVLYADANWGRDPEAAWSGRAGASAAMVADVPGTLRLGLQLGTRESFVQLGHRLDVGAGWRAAHAIGARVDDDGFGVTVDAGWMRAGADNLAVDARLAYRPATGAVAGRVGARYQVDLDAWAVNASGGWDVGDRAVAASAGVTWRDGAWRAELDGSAGYGWGSAEGGRWSASATLTAGYVFRVPLAPEVSDAFGGRRVGSVVGRVVLAGGGSAGVEGVAGGGSEALGDAAMEGLAGVIIEIGRYRVETDETGAFAIELPPGSYPAAIVAVTVPVAYRLLDPLRTEVEVRLREVTEVVWRAARTTVLSGRVLEDRDGDGVADDPRRGVAARLLLTDAEGLRRVLTTDADGTFSARGLVPGEAEALLLDVPAGATVVGEERRRVRLVAGDAAEVEFLVRPLVVVARTFSAQALRVRGVVLETDRVPPGAAPLVRVEVTGDAQSVSVVSAIGSAPLTLLDGAWVGRVEVPADADGVWPFTVIAVGEDGEANRRGQLVVAADAPALSLATDAPVRPGGDLRVTATAYLEVERLTVASPFGAPLTLAEVEPGRWEGVLSVPQGAEDAVWTLEAEAAIADGRVLGAQARFRVLAP